MKTTLLDKKVIIEQLKSDMAYAVILLIVFTVIMKIVLYKESLIVLFFVVSKFFYSIIIPGLFISLRVYKKLNFLTRLVLSSVFMIAIISITSYYLGLLGLHVKYHPYILPPLIILIGILLFFKSYKPEDF